MEHEDALRDAPADAQQDAQQESGREGRPEPRQDQKPQEEPRPRAEKEQPEPEPGSHREPSKTGEPRAEPSATEEPGAEISMAEESQAKDSPAEESEAEGATAQEPAAEESTGKATPAKKSTGKASPAEDSGAKASPVGASPAEEPEAEGPTAQEPAAKKSMGKASPAEESTVTASPAEEPGAEASPVEASPAEEPAAEVSPVGGPRVGQARGGAGVREWFGGLREGGRARLIGGSAVALVAVLVVLLLTFTTWSGGGSGASANGKGGDGAKGASDASVSIAPKDGSDEVATSGALRVSATKGRLTRVRVEDGKGNRVEGRMAADGSSWKPDTHLASGTEYTVDAVAEDAEGRESAKHAAFTTFVPENTFVGYFTPEDGDTVGAGMPVSLKFNRPVTHREQVEKAITVSADPQVDVEGHWFGNQRLDFRPEKYWKAGTKVTLDLNLSGVEGSEGVYGKQRKTVRFTVGRQQVSVVDAKKKTMTVTRDGKEIKTIPITSGSPQNPTYNGKMVVSEKYEVTRMNGETVGFGGEYDIKDVPHAMRLSTSGTFIHGNYWTPQPQFGQVNASHGCVGLFDRRGGGSNGTPGAWFFKNSMVGDVVEVKNSQDETIQPDNGLNGWNMDWDEWKAPQ